MKTSFPSKIRLLDGPLRGLAIPVDSEPPAVLSLNLLEFDALPDDWWQRPNKDQLARLAATYMRVPTVAKGSLYRYVDTVEVLRSF